MKLLGLKAIMLVKCVSPGCQEVQSIGVVMVTFLEKLREVMGAVPWEDVTSTV